MEPKSNLYLTGILYYKVIFSGKASLQPLRFASLYKSILINRVLLKGFLLGVSRKYWKYVNNFFVN